MERQGHRARVRRARVRADPRLRRVRLSRESRRELRADRLRDVRGCASTTSPSSRARCSTRSRWASTRPRRSSAMRSATASRSGRSTSRRARGTARSSRRTTRSGSRCGWACAGSRACSSRTRTRIIVRARRAERSTASRTSCGGPRCRRAAHTALAEAGALGELTRQRRDALWQVSGWVRRQDDSLDARRRRQRRAGRVRRADQARRDLLGLRRERSLDARPSARAAARRAARRTAGRMRATVSSGRDGQRGSSTSGS